MLNLTNFLKFIGVIPRFTIFQFGGGSSSSSPTLTPEQADLLKTQTEAFKSTFLPAYKTAITGATDTFNASAPYLQSSALQGFNTAQTTANALTPASLGALDTSKTTLQNIIDPNYINSMIKGYLQPVVEQNREATSSLNNQFLGAGQGGSSRHAFSQSNLQGLNEARLQSAGTNAISNIVGQQIGAAGTLGSMGFQGLTGALANNQAAVGFSNAPADLYAKYASILYGTPQSATPNFTGTQGTTSSGSGFKLSF